MTRTIVVFGSNGMLGQAFSSFFKSPAREDNNYDVILYGRKDVDAGSDSVHDRLLELSKSWPEGTVVLNAVGLIPQRGKHTNQQYMAVNAVFPHVLYTVCESVGALFIHITTVSSLQKQTPS